LRPVAHFLLFLFNTRTRMRIVGDDQQDGTFNIYLSIDD
jgi:hypothetical protein